MGGVATVGGRVLAAGTDGTPVLETAAEGWRVAPSNSGSSPPVMDASNASRVTARLGPEAAVATAIRNSA